MEASNSHMGKRGGTAGLLFFTAVSIDFGLPFPLKKRRILQNPSQQPPPSLSTDLFFFSARAKENSPSFRTTPPPEPLPNPKKEASPPLQKRSNSTPSQTPFLQSGRRKEGAYRLTRLALPKKKRKIEKKCRISRFPSLPYPPFFSFFRSHVLFLCALFLPPHFPSLARGKGE